jgi:hypothetical protein
LVSGRNRLRVFENRVLRKISGPKRDEVTEEGRKLHNEELRDLYSLSSIIRIIKSRRMRWACHVARIGKKRKAYRLLVDNIRMDLGEVDGVMWTGFVWLMIGRGGELL